MNTILGSGGVQSSSAKICNKIHRSMHTTDTQILLKSLTVHISTGRGTLLGNISYNDQEARITGQEGFCCCLSNCSIKLYERLSSESCSPQPTMMYRSNLKVSLWISEELHVLFHITQINSFVDSTHLNIPTDWSKGQTRMLGCNLSALNNKLKKNNPWLHS